MKKFKVVRFSPSLIGGILKTKGAPVEKQIEDVINQYISEGWEFVSYQTAHVSVAPGCLASLIGRKEAFLYYDVMLFSRNA